MSTSLGRIAHGIAPVSGVFAGESQRSRCARCGALQRVRFGAVGASGAAGYVVEWSRSGLSWSSDRPRCEVAR